MDAENEDAYAFFGAYTFIREFATLENIDVDQSARKIEKGLKRIVETYENENYEQMGVLVSTVGLGMGMLLTELAKKFTEKYTSFEKTPEIYAKKVKLLNQSLALSNFITATALSFAEKISQSREYAKTFGETMKQLYSSSEVLKSYRE